MKSNALIIHRKVGVVGVKCVFWKLNLNWDSDSDSRKNRERFQRNIYLQKSTQPFIHVELPPDTNDTRWIEEWSSSLNNLFILFHFSACHHSFSSAKMIGENSGEDYFYHAKLRILITSGSPRILCFNPDILAVDHTIDIFLHMKNFWRWLIRLSARYWLEDIWGHSSVKETFFATAHLWKKDERRTTA